MAFVVTHPRFRDALAGLGLSGATDYLDLPGVVYCGHPDRHVARVTLGSGAAAVGGYLKREHRVRWKHRLASAWAGFGLASRSLREFALLRDLAAAGIRCPEPLAAGEDDRGRAFLLVRELPGCRDLRAFLHDMAATPTGRRATARGLGAALARIHSVGFDHPDLYSKHVLVEGRPEEATFWFLDWQRSRRYREVSWLVRQRDLAALDATLADELVSRRARVACLGAYLREAERDDVPLPSLREAAEDVRRLAERLRGRRHIRELLEPPLAAGTQNLVWLDGEALCVTREFLDELSGQAPAWLSLAERAQYPSVPVRREVIERPSGLLAEMVHRRAARPLAWLWNLVRRRRVVSPELARAGVLFRLQRYGIATPRLLAVGQRSPWPWRVESLLLTEPLLGAAPLTAWLAATADGAERRQVLRHAGAVLRRLHDAGYVFASPDVPGRTLQVQDRRIGVRVVVGEPERLRKRRQSGRTWLRDLRALHDSLTLTCSRADQIRLLLGYLGRRRLGPDGRELAATVLGPVSGQRRQAKPSEVSATSEILTASTTREAA